VLDLWKHIASNEIALSDVGVARQNESIYSDVLVCPQLGDNLVWIADDCGPRSGTSAANTCPKTLLGKAVVVGAVSKIGLA